MWYMYTPVKISLNIPSFTANAVKYKHYLSFQLLETLDDDPSAKKLHLAHKFEQVAATIDGSPLY